MAKQIHVRMRKSRWAVQHADEDKPVSSHDRRADAVRAARTLAKENDADVVVFGLDEKPIQGDDVEGK